MPTAASSRAGQFALIAPISGVTSSDEVPDVITVTVTADGVVKVEGSRFIESQKKQRAYNLEVDLKKCTIKAKHVT